MTTSKSKKQMTLELSEEQMASLELRAKASGSHKAEVIRRALKLYDYIMARKAEGVWQSEVLEISLEGEPRENRMNHTNHYTLANAHPLDARIFTSDGGLIEAGSRADAERIVWDNNVLEEANRDLDSSINDLQGQVNDLRDNDGRDEDPDDMEEVDLDDLDDDDLEPDDTQQ